MRCLRLATGVVAMTLMLMLATVGTAPSASAAGEREEFLTLLNNYRVSLGLAPLQLDPELSSIAQGWAERIASSKQLVHPDDQTVGVSSPWLRLGENVALGSTVAITWQGLLDSPSHHTNMVDPGFTHVGIGVAFSDDGVLYISQRFMELPAEPVLEPEVPAAIEAPPVEPVPEVVVETPPEVLGAVLTRVDTNLAVIPPISYGGLAAAIDPPSAGNGFPMPLLLALIAGALLLLAGLSVGIVRSRRA